MQNKMLYRLIRFCNFPTNFLVANPGISHPIHIHGHGFQVIDMGSREEYENGNSAFVNATHLPVIKDTVTLRWNSFIRIRLRATNPGVWLLHCHVDFHHVCIQLIRAVRICVGNFPENIYYQRFSNNFSTSV